MSLEGAHDRVAFEYAHDVALMNCAMSVFAALATGVAVGMVEVSRREGARGAVGARRAAASWLAAGWLVQALNWLHASTLFAPEAPRLAMYATFALSDVNSLLVALGVACLHRRRAASAVSAALAVGSVVVYEIVTFYAVSGIGIGSPLPHDVRLFVARAHEYASLVGSCVAVGSLALVAWRTYRNVFAGLLGVGYAIWQVPVYLYVEHPIAWQPAIVLGLLLAILRVLLVLSLLPMLCCDVSPSPATPLAHAGPRFIQFFVAASIVGLGALVVIVSLLGGKAGSGDAEPFEAIELPIAMAIVVLPFLLLAAVRAVVRRSERNLAHAPDIAPPALDVKEIRAMPIHFGIITIREDEYRAVLSRFQPRTHVFVREHRYEIADVAIQGHGIYRCAIVRVPEQGEGPGQRVATELIQDLDPQWLLLVGICGAVPSREFFLGDVVCATRVHDFSVSAAIDDGRRRFQVTGGPMHRKVQTILAALHAMERQGLLGWNAPASIGARKPRFELPAPDSKDVYGDEAWQKFVRDAAAHHVDASFASRAPVVTARSTASSDTLVKSALLLQQWLESASHVGAIEMELAGIYRASHAAHNEKPILAVRGISDVVGLRRDPAWTDYACNSAAAFAHRLVASTEILGVVKPWRDKPR